MNFPPINGVDEGSLLYCIMCCLSGFVGSVALWTQKYQVFGGIYTASQLLTWVLQHALPLAALVAFYMIYSKRHYAHFKQLWDAKYFIMQCVFYVVSFTTYYVAEQYSVN